MLIFTLVRYFGGSVFNENCQMLKGNRFLCDSQFNNFPVNIKWSKYNTDISHHRSASPALLTIELWCCSSSSINTNSSIPYISANSNSNATSTPSLDYFMPEHRICVTELKFERCPCAHKQRTRLWNGTYIHTHTHPGGRHTLAFSNRNECGHHCQLISWNVSYRCSITEHSATWKSEIRITLISNDAKLRALYFQRKLQEFRR